MCSLLSCYCFTVSFKNIKTSLTITVSLFAVRQLYTSGLHHPHPSKQQEHFYTDEMKYSVYLILSPSSFLPLNLALSIGEL